MREADGRKIYIVAKTNKKMSMMDHRRRNNHFMALDKVIVITFETDNLKGQKRFHYDERDVSYTSC